MGDGRNSARGGGGRVGDGYGREGVVGNVKGADGREKCGRWVEHLELDGNGE